jgi:hypothetical protein
MAALSRQSPRLLMLYTMLAASAPYAARYGGLPARVPSGQCVRYWYAQGAALFGVGPLRGVGKSLLPPLVGLVSAGAHPQHGGNCLAFVGLLCS